MPVEDLMSRKLSGVCSDWTRAEFRRAIAALPGATHFVSFDTAQAAVAVRVLARAWIWVWIEASALQPGTVFGECLLWKR